MSRAKGRLNVTKRWVVRVVIGEALRSHRQHQQICEHDRTTGDGNSHPENQLERHWDTKIEEASHVSPVRSEFDRRIAAGVNARQLCVTPRLGWRALYRHQRAIVEQKIQMLEVGR